MLAKETEHAEIFYWRCEMCAVGFVVMGVAVAFTSPRPAAAFVANQNDVRQGRGGDECHD
jgi:hypothetical protein